ncbi:MAG: PIN domain-containing protein [Polaromonas sp.]|nr:PIN domain-containing protein [Polaromonas sp.]
MSTATTTTGVFVDADILIYSEDGADPTKQQAALAWLTVLWQRGMGRISTQVLNEFYLLATRKINPPMPAGDARAEVRRYELWQPWQTDHATVESAWAVESRYGLHYRDSLVVAAAQHLGCRYLLSEDLAHEQHYGGVQVINPFKTGIELLEQAP